MLNKDFHKLSVIRPAVKTLGLLPLSFSYYRVQNDAFCKNLLVFSRSATICRQVGDKFQSFFYSQLVADMVSDSGDRIDLVEFLLNQLTKIRRQYVTPLLHRPRT